MLSPFWTFLRVTNMVAIAVDAMGVGLAFNVYMVNIVALHTSRRAFACVSTVSKSVAFVPPKRVWDNLVELVPKKSE